MIVVDSSALVAILQFEDEADHFLKVIGDAKRPAVSVVSLVETSMVISSRKGDAGLLDVDALLRELAVDIVPVDRVQGLLARDAFLRYGRGRHPARLNMGDCFSYALARAMGWPLLFKGDDFGRTDLAAATAPPPQPGG